MYPDIPNLKKRKCFGGTVEDLNLPTPKHKCGIVGISSQCDAFMMNALDRVDANKLGNKGADNMIELDTKLESTQGSNNFKGDSWSSTEKMFDAKTYSCDGASTSRSHSGTEISGLESTTVRDLKHRQEDIISSKGERYDMEWPDEHYKQDTAEGLDHFLSSSGVNANVLDQSSQKWSAADQETQMGRRKPTIDQEFEQYFSMLML